MSEIRSLIDQICTARRYTEGLLAATPEADWPRMPPGGVSHISWQVGHLAMAQYRLAMDRIRGRRDDDEAIIPSDFLRRFGRESVPGADPASEPSPEALRTVFDRVHARLVEELSTLDDRVLDLPTEGSHRLCRTKREILTWCAHHEMIHAGQIGLLRRQLGLPAIW